MLFLECGDIVFGPCPPTGRLDLRTLDADRWVVRADAAVNREGNQHMECVQKISRRRRCGGLGVDHLLYVLALQHRDTLVAVLVPETFQDAAPRSLCLWG